MTDDTKPTLIQVAKFEGNLQAAQELKVDTGMLDTSIAPMRPKRVEEPSLPYSARKIGAHWVCGVVGCHGRTIPPRRGQVGKLPQNVACANHVKAYKDALLDVSKNIRQEQWVQEQEAKKIASYQHGQA